MVPNYLQIYGFARGLGADVKTFDLHDSLQWKPDLDEIKAIVSEKTKLICICNPNNPTGTYISKNSMLDLRKKLRSDILLVVDDAYFEFLNKKDYVSGLELFKNSENVLITRTFSKIYGLAGLRLGWAYSSKTIINSMYQMLIQILLILQQALY